MLRSLATILILLLAATARAQTTTRSSDMLTLKTRLVARLARQYADPAKAADALKALRPDGTFADIDYADRRRAAWSPARHLDRLAAMAALSRTPEASKDLVPALLRGLDAWLAKDPQSDNWWNQEIGTPNTLGAICLLVEDRLSPEQKAKSLALIRRAKIGMTGQNLVWLSSANILRGLLESDDKLIATAFARIWAEITDDKPEGIQPDASFHQHGPQLYAAGYGRGFAADNARLMALAAGTAYAAPPEKTKLLGRYVLDGLQWMVRGESFEPTARGREISRRGGGTTAGLASVLADLVSLKIDRTAELEAFAKRLAAKEPDAQPVLAGNRQFFCSDLMVHHRPAFYASAKFTSARIIGTESGNGEALLNHYLLYTTSFLMRRGDEYTDIAPLWDWTRLPGATGPALQAPPPQPTWGKDAKGQSTFVGGVSDGSVGLAAESFTRRLPAGGTLAYKKAFAFFDDCYVVLLADLHADAPNVPILTGINQCYLRGPVRAGSPDHVLAPGRHDLPAAAWLWHDQVGYVFPAPTHVQAANQPQEGSWRQLTEIGSTDHLRKDVFTLWINHGPAPAGQSLAYVVVPNIAPAALPGPAAQLDLLNTPGLQAAYHRPTQTLLAAFYRPGKLTLKGVPALEVDQPCLLLLHLGVGAPTLAVSNPDNAPLLLTVRIDGATHHLSLPGGPAAGATVIRRLSR